MEILAKMIRNPKTLGSVFAIHGEAGTGKTTLIKDGLSEIFGLPFIFISLGGAHDRAFLTGSNYVYEGSMCGKIIQSLKQSQCMNPIFYFDELDKVSNTDKGQEIINLLIHLTDYTQNTNFMDDYMDGIVLDLSKATFIFSFNDKNKISPILLDRMELIKFNSYTLAEKQHISRNYLLPKIITNIFGTTNTIDIIISEQNLEKIVSIPERNRYKRKITNINTTNNPIPNVNPDTINTNNNPIPKIAKTTKYTKTKIYNNNNKIINKKINKKKKKYYKDIIINNLEKVNNYGGIRYIKKRLEKIISKVNLDIIMNKIKISKNKTLIINENYINNII